MIRDIKTDMKDYIPRFYSDSRIVSSIIDPESEEYADLNLAVKDVIDQFFIDSATWGLSRWESMCGIRTDETKPLDQRRSVVKARLRGVGTVTVAFVKSVAQAYENGELMVIEHSDTYKIEIKFIGTRGIPPALDDIQASLRSIIPAHLGIDFTFAYLVWNEIDSAAKTWDEWDALAMTWDTMETFKP